MLEEEYFEKFKSLGMYLAYSNVVDVINKLKDMYLDEAEKGIRSWTETTYILNALDIVRGGAKVKGRENLKKC